jgi:hypothetical protein
MDTLLKDLKRSVYMFLRTPGFTLTALATLTLGIAGNTAIFSVMNALLKPFAFRDPERIVMFQNVLPTGRFGSASPTEFNWWRQQIQTVQDISAYDFSLANWTGASFPEQIPLMHASADFFRLCGIQAVLGRLFTASDDLPNAPKTVVLAYEFWRRRFAGVPSVLGQSMILGGQSYEIIGVLGPFENGPLVERSTLSGDIEIHEPPDVYLPFQIDPYSADHGHFFNVGGRLKPGITLAAANAALAASYPGYARKWVGEDAPGRTFSIQPLHEAIVGGVRHSLLLLFGAVGFVLLIACANVANLLLARATGRKKEIAVRTAVGAGRGQIIRQLFTESIMLSVTSGVLGLALGYAGIRTILTFIPDSMPRIGLGGANIVLDWRVAGFTMAVSVLTGLVFGLVPALETSRADLSSTLKENGNRGGTGLRHKRTQALVVTTEMALAVVLVIGGALLIRFVSEGFAKQFWPDSDPLNERIIIGNGPPRRIVGIVGDVHDRGLDRTARAGIYEPLVEPREVAWAIRTHEAVPSIRFAVQNELSVLSGGLPVGEVRTMEDLLSRSMATETFRALVLTIFAGSALFLAAIGVYGLMAYVVSDREHEVAIRLALGARSADIQFMLIFQGVRPAFTGVGLGLLAAFGLARGLATFLFGIRPWDPLVFCVIPIVLIGVALIAVSLPALRAGRLDPVQALRRE